LKKRRRQRHRNRDANDGEGTEEEADEDLSEWAEPSLSDETYRALGASATMFFQVAQRVDMHLRSGITNRQIIGAIVDPLINEVPPALSAAVVQTMTSPVDQIVYKLLDEMLLSAFVPASKLGMPENTPVNEPDPTVPFAGPASALASQLGANALTLLELGQKVMLHTQAKQLGDGGITGQLKKKLSTEIANTVLEKDLPDAVSNLHNTLKTSLNVMLPWTLTRTLTRNLLTTLTQSLSVELIKLLCELLSRSFSKTPTKEITRFLTPTLVHTLGLTVTHALTRPPLADYECWYCLKKQTYCPNCQGVMTNDYYMDYYIHYYSHYYSLYFGGHYSSDLADIFVENYGAYNPFVPPYAQDKAGIGKLGTRGPGGLGGKGKLRPSTASVKTDSESPAEDVSSKDAFTPWGDWT